MLKFFKGVSFMAFNFGSKNTSLSSKVKIDKDTTVITDCVFYNHFDPSEDYYLFLLESPPIDFNYDTKTSPMLETTIKKISAMGYKSYIIATATIVYFDKEKFKRVYDFMDTFKSNWRDLLNYNGVTPKAIMPFGAALHAVNKGTHLTTDCFYDSWMNKSYYYLNDEFIGKYNCFIYPVDNFEEIYRKAFRTDSQVNWKTRFFWEQLLTMLTKSKELPLDMRPYQLIRCTDGMDISQEETTGRMIKHSAKDILTSLLNSDVLAWDTETDSVSWVKGTTVKCITMTNDGQKGYYIPFDSVILKDPELVKLLVQVFYTCKTMVGANIKFDLHWLKKFIPELDFFKIQKIDDVGQLSHCLNSDRTKGLKPLSYFYTYFGGYDNELDEFKTKTKVSNYTLIPDRILYKYATLDAIVTWRVFQAELAHARKLDTDFPNEKPIDKCSETEGKWGFERWYSDFMVPAYPVFAQMEHEGICIDYEYQCEVREKLEKNIQDIQEKLSKIWNVPKDFDFGSTQKLGILFEKLGWPCIEKDKAGKYYATSEKCILEWQRQNMPGINELIDLRKNKSFLITFIGTKETKDSEATGWEQFVHYNPERNEYIINHSYNIMGTSTFRHIARDPNFQNIPTHSKLAKEIKRCITVPNTLHYTITSDDGTVFEGGELDTVEVENRGRVHLNEVLETDNVIPNSFVKYVSEYDSYFEEA